MGSRQSAPRGVARAPSLDWGVAVRVLPGESAIGDTYVVQPTAHGALVAVIDGLGHGAEAASPAAIASSTIEQHAGDPLPALVQRCHDALIGTRGVVMSLAAFDYADQTMTWVGIGDVAGVLAVHDRAVAPQRMALIHRGGIVGVRLPTVRPWVIPLSDGDTLVFATDGVHSDFELSLPVVGPSSAAAEEIMERFAKGTDDALVLVARFGGSREVNG